MEPVQSQYKPSAVQQGADKQTYKHDVEINGAKYTVTIHYSKEVDLKQAQTDMQKRIDNIVDLATELGIGKKGLQKLEVSDKGVKGVWESGKVVNNFEKKLSEKKEKLEQKQPISNKNQKRIDKIDRQLEVINKTVNLFKQIHPMPQRQEPERVQIGPTIEIKHVESKKSENAKIAEFSAAVADIKVQGSLIKIRPVQPKSYKSEDVKISDFESAERDLNNDISNYIKDRENFHINLLKMISEANKVLEGTKPDDTSKLREIILNEIDKFVEDSTTYLNKRHELIQDKIQNLSDIAETPVNGVIENVLENTLLSKQEEIQEFANEKIYSPLFNTNLESIKEIVKDIQLKLDPKKMEPNQKLLSNNEVQAKCQQLIRQIQHLTAESTIPKSAAKTPKVTIEVLETKPPEKTETKQKTPKVTVEFLPKGKIQSPKKAEPVKTSATSKQQVQKSQEIYRKAEIVMKRMKKNDTQTLVSSTDGLVKIYEQLTKTPSPSAEEIKDLRKVYEQHLKAFERIEHPGAKNPDNKDVKELMELHEEINLIREEINKVINELKEHLDPSTHQSNPELIKLRLARDEIVKLSEAIGEKLNNGVTNSNSRNNYEVKILREVEAKLNGEKGEIKNMRAEGENVKRELNRPVYE